MSTKNQVFFNDMCSIPDRALPSEPPQMRLESVLLTRLFVMG